MNKQREVIYTQRREILAGADLREKFLEMMDEEPWKIWWKRMPSRTIPPKNGTGTELPKGFISPSAVQFDIPEETMVPQG